MAKYDQSARAQVYFIFFIFHCCMLLDFCHCSTIADVSMAGNLIKCKLVKYRTRAAQRMMISINATISLGLLPAYPLSCLPSNASLGRFVAWPGVLQPVVEAEVNTFDYCMPCIMWHCCGVLCLLLHQIQKKERKKSLKTKMDDKKLKAKHIAAQPRQVAPYIIAKHTL